jgi:hypothetical protein
MAFMWDRRNVSNLWVLELFLKDRQLLQPPL